MKIHLWSAYASNNSGAYTIVGSFRSPEAAENVVSELRPVLEAQTRWEIARIPETKDSPSPLRTFAAEEGVPLEDYIEWPEFDEDLCPKVAAVGANVVLHHPYTVSLPKFFGHWFYAKGGRVTRELDHSHHRLAVVFQVWWSSGSSEPGNNEERAKIVVDRLSGPEGPLAKYASKEVPPAWEIHSGWEPPPIRLGACFDDVVAGVAAVQEVLRRFDAQVRIDVIEAWRDEDDPLAFLRSAPRQVPPQP